MPRQAPFNLSHAPAVSSSMGQCSSADRRLLTNLNLTVMRATFILWDVERQPRRASQPMAKTLSQMLGIEGIQAEKLLDAGIRTGGDLLRHGTTGEGRQAIAQASGLPEEAIRRWVERVDLLRVNGIGPSNAALLELAGIHSVEALARQEPGWLHRGLVRAYPGAPAGRQIPDGLEGRPVGPVGQAAAGGDLRLAASSQPHAAIQLRFMGESHIAGQPTRYLSLHTVRICPLSHTAPDG